MGRGNSGASGFYDMERDSDEDSMGSVDGRGKSDFLQQQPIRYLRKAAIPFLMGIVVGVVAVMMLGVGSSPRTTATIGKDNCNATRKCAGKGLQCYEQNNRYAQCRANCTPGPDPLHWDHFPWSCQKLGERTPWDLPCGSNGQDCRTSAFAQAAWERPAMENLSAVVINLDRRPDRMVTCADRLKERCPGLQFARLSAADAQVTEIPVSDVATSWNNSRNVKYQIARSIREGTIDTDHFEVRNMTLSPGERGCASSHISAWRHCVEAANGTERPLLVLEDDAVPIEGFPEIFKRAMSSLPPDAGILYLGYIEAADWRSEVSPELVEAEYVWTTVGYIIWPACARMFLSHLPVNEPVDDWMSGFAADGRVKSYCVRPKIVLQANSWNFASDIWHSDEH